MDPFTIHCSSCQSRIRVRNPSMIGQIANCPKCGSMIMIAAPQPTAAAPQQILVDSRNGSVTDSVAVTKEALPVPEEGLFGELPPLEQGSDQAFRSEGLPELASPELASPEPAAFESLSPTSWMPEPTPPPRADEVAASAPAPSSSRQIMLVAAIGLCSVAVACGIFFVFLQWYARPSTVAANQTAARSTATATPRVDPAPDANAANALDAVDAEPLEIAVDEAAPPGLSSSASPAQPSGENVADASAAAQPAELENASATGAPNGSPSDSSLSDGSLSDGSLPDGSLPDASASAALGSSAPGSSTPGATAGSADANPAVASGAPLAVGGAPLSSQLTPDIDSTFATPGGDENAQAVKETLPPGLQSFASIFDQSLVPVLSDATVPLGAAPEAGDEDTAPVDVAPAASPATLVLPETLEQKQATTISGMRIQERPLAEVLSTLALLSDIPFTADLDALMAAGVDRNQAINYLSATPVTVSNILATLAEQYQLSFEPYEKKLFIVRGLAGAVQARVPASLPVADLVDGDDQTTALSAALSELLPELGDGFRLADGAAEADLEKVNRLLWFQVARLLESWRVARGIANAETAALVPKSSLLPAWPVDAAQQLAQKNISQSLLPAPLAYDWQRLANEAGMTCWVDWPSLASAQTSPGQIGMSISHGRPLQELLQHDADKYQVVFALEDAHTLWATTPEMHRFQPRLYVLPMDGKSIDDWRKELEPLTPSNPDGSEALKVVASPDGQFVFIRCCRPVLAQPQL